ncbi:MAG: hypothetical protein ACW9W4_05625 [Candidatus Nitrosopumilus sp. bin_7KS]
MGTEDNVGDDSRQNKKDKINKAKSFVSNMLQFYYVSLPLQVALILLWQIDNFRKIPDLHSPLLEPAFEIGLLFVVMGSTGALAVLAQSKLETRKLRKEINQLKNSTDEKIHSIERSLKPDLYYSATYAKKMKKTENKINSMKKIPSISWGLLVVGAILLLIGIFLYHDASINDRSGIQTWNGINFYKTKSLSHTDVDMNFIVKDDESLIHIFYSTNNIQNGTFIGLYLPYEGQLTNNHDWNVLPMAENSSFIYKKFDCDENNECNYHYFEDYYGNPDGNDQYNLLFKIDGLIDTKEAYTHTIGIPFGGANPNDVMEMIQFEISDEGVWSWQENWENVDASLSISIQDDATEINLIPDAHPKSHLFKATDVTRTIYSWGITSQQTVYHLDYIMPEEKTHYENYRTWGIVFVSNGISILGVFIGTIKWKNRFS